MSLLLLRSILFCSPRSQNLIACPLQIIILFLLQVVYRCESAGRHFDDDDGYYNYHVTDHDHDHHHFDQEIEPGQRHPAQQPHHQDQQPPLQQIQQQDIVYSYIGNFIATREAVFLISIVALVLSWRALIHVLWYSRSRHGLVNGLLKSGIIGEDDTEDGSFPSSPTKLDYVLDRLGYVFDEAMKTYTDYTEDVDENGEEENEKKDNDHALEGDEEDDDASYHYYS